MKPYLLALLLTLLCLFSCSKNNDLDTESPYPGKRDNITIQMLAWHYANTNTVAPVESDWVIRGRITANDRSGNIQNTLYLQDPSGAIGVAVDALKLSSNYQVGQELYLSLKGLSVVNNNGTLHIGANDAAGKGIPEQNFASRVFLVGEPDSTVIKPKQVDFSKLNDDMLNRLVSIQNISFARGGKSTFVSNNQPTSEVIMGTPVNIAVLTNPAADFAAETLPRGNGSIVGILTRAGDQWHVHLRSKADILSFDGIMTEVLEPVQANAR